MCFDFRLGRGRDGPRQFLGQFEGILQTDGYSPYDQIGGPRIVHAAWWAHSRRLFLEAVQLNPCWSRGELSVSTVKLVIWKPLQINILAANMTPFSRLQTSLLLIPIMVLFTVAF